MEKSFLPIYKSGMDEIQDGCVIKLPEFCKKKSSKCENFYRSIFDKEGLNVCPYGFNTYINVYKGEKDIFTGFRVKGEFDAKKTNPKIDLKDKNRIITYDEMLEYIKYYQEHLELKKENYYLKESMSNIIHDVKEYNGNIKNKSEFIMNKGSSKKKEREKVVNKGKGIWAMSQLISTRLKSYDYLYSNFPYKNGSKIEFNFYRNFDKIRRCFEDEAKQNNKKIEVSSRENCSEVYLYDSVEYMPFLIIENALKYSMNNSTIEVEIIDKSEEQIIIVKSEGILVEDSELDSLFKRGYRGKLAKEYKQKGNGIGLYLVNEICKANDIDIKIETERCHKKNSQGVDLGFFKVILCINKVEKNY
ncbi:sensor histidine kinase [Clostridium perfringens]|nr:ATP-binding protein [Clostridium perfringens]MDM0487148.1 ATP-binding protein [Clostridium perfringens]MDM0950470.1 ATP-binding protein [Clostridium perfringens]MDU2663520.1 ATP-binding protein [Clostridium perfringens]HAT4349130.1 sensor histidine kinase [Clostridium perfringens]